MSEQVSAAIGLACILVMAGAAEAAHSGIEGSAGQVNFVPVSEMEVSLNPSSPALDVWSCESGPAGLSVTGHVDPSIDNPVIAVTKGEQGQPGARVGKAVSMDAAPGEFGEIGDFRVILPWATGDAIFAVRISDSTEDHGPTSRCPEANGG